MQEFVETTLVTSKPEIVHFLQKIAEQNITLFITSTRTDIHKEYRTNILHVDEDSNRISLYQLLPIGWQKYITPGENINVSCHTKTGAISFTGQLAAPLDQENTSHYCQLVIPEQLNNQQLRSFLRVSLMEYHAKVHIETSNGRKLNGTCRNLSLDGGQFQFNQPACNLKQGDIIEKSHILIENTLDVTFSARISHIEETSDTTLVGIKFLDLGLGQLNTIRSAMKKIEASTLIKQPSVPLH